MSITLEPEEISELEMMEDDDASRRASLYIDAVESGEIKATGPGTFASPNEEFPQGDPGCPPLEC